MADLKMNPSEIPGVLLLDTTVLSNFALVGQLSLLGSILKCKGIQPLITSQVREEFQQGVKRKLFETDVDTNWMKTIGLSEEEVATARKLQGVLGVGEASCLAIALERGLPIATDDMKARDIARRLGVPVTGTLGILGWAVKIGLISLEEGDSVLRSMRRQGYFSPVGSLRELL
jgi:predicted nucleic acid-binding protein